MALESVPTSPQSAGVQIKSISAGFMSHCVAICRYPDPFPSPHFPFFPQALLPHPSLSACTTHPLSPRTPPLLPGLPSPISPPSPHPSHSYPPSIDPLSTRHTTPPLRNKKAGSFDPALVYGAIQLNRSTDRHTPSACSSRPFSSARPPPSPRLPSPSPRPLRRSSS